MQGGDIRRRHRARSLPSGWDGPRIDSTHCTNRPCVQLSSTLAFVPNPGTRRLRVARCLQIAIFVQPARNAREYASLHASIASAMGVGSAWCSVNANNVMRLCILEKAVGRRPVILDGREEAANLAANMILSTSAGVDTSVEDTMKCLLLGFDPLGKDDPFGNYVLFTIWAEKKHFDARMGGVQGGARRHVPLCIRVDHGQIGHGPEGSV